MQLRHLKAFIAAAQTLNFTRAAEAVHLSQSSVTEQIQALEAEFGVSLFDRSHRRLALTSAGQRLLPYAVELLDLAGEARSAVAMTSAAVSGALAVGGLETLCSTRLPGLLADFGRAHPSVELKLKAADSSGLRNGLMGGELDVAFMFGAPPTVPAIRSEVLADEELLIVLPPGHRLAGRATLLSEDLSEEMFVVTPRGCVYRKMFDEAMGGLPGEPKRLGEAASIGAILGLVEAGQGCALVPASAVAARTSRLVAKPWAGAGSTPISMLWRHRRVQSPATAAFLAAVRDHFRLHTNRWPPST
ncbi:hypothetical protein CXZ10_02315 [Pleomorphomonas diazotrophica]|uniref:HTH lysR-type domain-containing protein n=1 Tax=Pleomorphomonas diazotrophica TaxID=1166257 RepID=A0A1I4R2S0_9HYPH|nr:LysR family transcriptional regulator [Pleomorphomonas diazotrophica]PKR90244.1 hypothetical protein CXZ10_02315 [Pleomorphomonas diazotrophica]SFM46541.1 DNA-binding transcriptional regulator, LysR family [Pleomorphomonas diazotrophica]